MRKMKKVLTAAAMISAGIVFAEQPKDKLQNKAAAGGQKKACEMPDAGRGCGSMMLKDLNLNDDQKAAVKKLHEEHMERMKEARTAVTEARKKLMELQTNKDVSEDAIKAASAQLADATSKMAMNRLKMRKEMNALLTPEQQQKLNKNMQEKKERMLKHMQEMHKKMEANKNKACARGAAAKGGAKKTSSGKGSQGAKRSCCR